MNAPKVLTAHLDDIDRDALVVVYDSGAMEIATRPGTDQRWITWGIPAQLTAVDR